MFQPIIRSLNHATSYLWPRGGHTHTHFGGMKVISRNQAHAWFNNLVTDTASVSEINSFVVRQKFYFNVIMLLQIQLLLRGNNAGLIITKRINHFENTQFC